jgi:membrane protease YdiL (CAAX protease family)
VATQAVALPVLYWPIRRLIDGDPGASARQLVGEAQGVGDAALLIVATAIMAPLVEELFFRGLLLRSLHRRFGPTAAAVVSAVLFALVHRQPLAFPGLMLFGLIAAGLALRTGRLGPSWALHAGFNLTTLMMLGLF